MNATLRAAVWGAAVGDALGVPFEFKERDSFSCSDIVGNGTHNQPAGTWSDDTALLLATCDSIRECGGIDTVDMLARFRDWLENGAYTPDGAVFDVGGTTRHAIETGEGGVNEWDNGNGSLMRIAPLSFTDASDDEIRAVSAITHAHSISTDACVELVHVIRDAIVDAEAVHARLREKYGNTPREQVSSGGFVLDSLDASFWSFAVTDTYVDCVLTAVNLGDDTDTTGCVAGAIAAAAYGFDAIPQEWVRAIRGAEVLEACLF